jgi:hypothetical protein
VIGAALGAVACSEPTGLPRQTAALDGRPEAAMHFLRWPIRSGPARFVVVADRRRLGFASAQAEGPSLERYQVSFWAVKGRAHTLRIDYVSPDQTTPFLQLAVPAGALESRPDGSPIAEGDSVLITVTVDSSLVRVRFEPTGLVFNATSPLALDIYYGGASQDLDGDGDVDDVDRAIREQRLGVWWQELEGTPWLLLPASHDPSAAHMAVSLFHFSGYAVSW